MNPEKRATILLADDHEAALVQATRVLSETYEIVGTTANGLEVLAASARLDPDVIVLDIAMPGLDGLEAARRLKARGCRSRLVFLTVWADADYVREALEIGAAGYVVEVSAGGGPGPAVAAAQAGETYVTAGLSPAVARPGARGSGSQVP